VIYQKLVDCQEKKKYFFTARMIPEKPMKPLVLHRFMREDSLAGHNGERAAHTAGFNTLFPRSGRGRCA
jgi:hypothetical protein